jgi:hypothetical protein
MLSGIKVLLNSKYHVLIECEWTFWKNVIGCIRKKGLPLLNQSLILGGNVEEIDTF